MDRHWGKTLSAFLLMSLATGCGGSYFVPMELAPPRTETTVLGSDPIGEPTLHVITHTDGLGWQVQARQEWITRQEVAEHEYWNGFQYEPAKSTARQVVISASSVISCPGSLLAHLIVRGGHLMGVLDGPEPAWHIIKAYCGAPLVGMDPWTERQVQQPGPIHDPTTTQERVIRPVIDGRVQIRWIHRRWDPVGLEYPLTPAASTIDIRLRELAPVLLRTHAANVLAEGTFEIAVITGEQTIREALPVSPSTMTAALASDLVRRPTGDWPTVLRVRVEATLRELADIAQTTLTELAIPVVTRGTGSRALQSVQAKEVSPRYQEGLPTSIGQWTGANVVLALTSAPLTPSTRLFSVSASSVETGLLLGQFTVEGADVRTPDVTSAIRGQLAFLLTPEGAAPRRGTLIEDRR